jgi:hypothetical protein
MVKQGPRSLSAYLRRSGCLLPLLVVCSETTLLPCVFARHRNCRIWCCVAVPSFVRGYKTRACLVLKWKAARCPSPSFRVVGFKLSTAGPRACDIEPNKKQKEKGRRDNFHDLGTDPVSALQLRMRLQMRETEMGCIVCRTLAESGVSGWLVLSIWTAGA